MAVHTIWAAVSNDGGDNFAPRVNLHPGLSGISWHPRIACDGTGSAVVVWTNDLLDYSQILWTSRYDGSSWSSHTEVPVPLDEYLEFPRLTFTDRALGQPTNVLLVYQDSPAVYLNRSTDGGATFAPYVRLDEGAPEPDNSSYDPRVAADGYDNVWVSWKDRSANRSASSIALVRSTDGGATLGPVIRMDKQVPGAFYNSYYHNTSTAALPEVGLFAWYAQNGTRTSGHLFLADDRSDDDSDGVNGSLDCDDTDPDVYPGAPQLCDGVNSDCDDPAGPTSPRMKSTATPTAGGSVTAIATIPTPTRIRAPQRSTMAGTTSAPVTTATASFDEVSGNTGFHDPSTRPRFHGRSRRAPQRTRLPDRRPPASVPPVIARCLPLILQPTRGSKMVRSLIRAASSTTWFAPRPPTSGAGARIRLALSARTSASDRSDRGASDLT